MIIRPATPEDRSSLPDLWLRSVRATHHFLCESQIQDLLDEVREGAFEQLEIWILADKSGLLLGFMGLDGANLDALFLSPDFLRCGGGTRLVDHARRLKGPLRVDVNEQNPEALKFYQALGFRVTGRSELDSGGRPFPLLHLEESGHF